MRVVLQRVSRASVEVDGEIVGRIAQGWLALVGVAKGDTDAEVEKLAEKVVGLRAFSDDQGKMNLCLADVGGALLSVSQFTLLADCRGGRRPSFTDAGDPAEAERLYARFNAKAEQLGVKVAKGVFRADMKVELVNNGPVTFLLDSRKTF